MSTNNKNYLIVVVGPTAIGKTALSIALAQHFNSDIVSCDSRQFYREMRIGTAVPSEQELASAKHHFIQNLSIEDEFSVGDYEKQALECLDQLFEKNNIQIVVGGSGLFVNAILQGFDDFPEIDPQIRTTLNQRVANGELEQMQQELKQLDPVSYQNIALDNPQRLTRALEICIGSGKPYSSFLNQKKNTRNFTPIVIGLTAERELMYQRINKRVDIMVDQGLLQEVETLLPFKNNNALQTVGYREIFDYLEHNCSLEHAIEEIKKNTRRFAKRQITWFKRMPQVSWFDFQTPSETIIDHIKQTIE